jgi:hypothetical protein
MRAVLVFRLPQEQEEFDNASHGGDWRWAMQELDEYLKRRDDSDEEAARQAAIIRNVLHGILDERGLALFD